LSLKEDLEGLASTKEKGIQMMAYTKGFTTAYRRPHLLGPPMSPTSLKTAEIRQSGRSKIEDRLLRLTAFPPPLGRRCACWARLPPGKGAPVAGISLVRRAPGGIQGNASRGPPPPLWREAWPGWHGMAELQAAVFCISALLGLGLGLLLACSTPHSALCTLHSALCTLRPPLPTPHSPLPTPHSPLFLFPGGGGEGGRGGSRCFSARLFFSLLQLCLRRLRPADEH
jgi:hypothetical protein